MALQNINPTKTSAWEKLNQHYAQMKNISIKEMFADDITRAKKFNIHWEDFLLDYSKNSINQDTFNLLQDLAKEVHL